jgi:TRAP-type mannitol/chloroaromatic compound transport system permease small subunit
MAVVLAFSQNLAIRREPPARRFAAADIAHYTAPQGPVTCAKMANAAPIMRSSIERLAQSVAACIDRGTAAIGRAAAWCCLYVVIAEFAVVVMRYALGLGSIKLQESVLYAHAGLFMLATAWTLHVGGHVRVDIFYTQAKPRTRALVDLLGAIFFLLPFAAALAALSLPYAERSWAILERSRESSGLPFVYLLKTLIPIFALLLGLQGVAQAIRAALVLGRAAPLPSSASGRG